MSGEAGARRRSSVKERSKSQSQEAAPAATAPATTANTKLIEAEKAETGKVNKSHFTRINIQMFGIL